jgi:hypothetical protein
MRYDTSGDYWTEGGCIQFRILSLGNADYEFLITLHELVEKQIARKMGISEQTIDAWDLAHEDEDEPGAMEGCPYREAHMIAESVERVIAVKLGVDWDHYDKTVREVMARHLPPADPTVRDAAAELKYAGGGYVSRKDGRQPTKGRTKVARGRVKERSVLKGR